MSGSWQDLARWIEAQPKLLGDEWVKTLGSRKQEEAAFHDSDRQGHRDEAPESAPNRRFYQAAGVVEDHMQAWIMRHSPGAILLDYACGNGKMSIAAAEAGAALTVGIDISEVSVANATESAATAGYAGVTRFLQRDCENTELPSDTFSACLCSGMLHHLDLPRAFAELDRVMAPGGRILCVEALAYNPFIQLYRNRTPELRTAWEKEHILSLRDVEFAKRWFGVENLRFHLMTAPLATFLPVGPIRTAGLELGGLLDSVLTRVPVLQLWSWMFSFELVKPGGPITG